ncbi:MULTISPECIES: hypothetical protein [unclassified Mesorhizobium]|uniref:hypothetical protein n=1 Tax=unclassified Mesorhizobium TaxID=325217 RepID=UPI003339B93B
MLGHGAHVRRVGKGRKERSTPLTKVPQQALRGWLNESWLARWLPARDIEAYAIHPASPAGSREHRRAKTDSVDTELLMRASLGWLRGEKRHCSMAAIPTLREEDARRSNRERPILVGEQTRLINRIQAILARFGIPSFRLEPAQCGRQAHRHPRSRGNTAAGQHPRRVAPLA